MAAWDPAAMDTLLLLSCRSAARAIGFEEAARRLLPGRGRPADPLAPRARRRRSHNIGIEILERPPV